MRSVRGEYLLIIGLAAAVTGVVLPFLMVTQVIESTFFLNFFAYFLQVGGLFLGFIGTAYLVRTRKSKSKRPQHPFENPSDDHKDW